jgi:two-component system, response regulator
MRTLIAQLKERTASPLVLLVEDDPDDEKLILRGLASCGLVCDVKVAYDGQQAVEYLESEEPTPDLIILDMKLPKLNGIEVLQRLRKMSKVRRTPVVMLTSTKTPGLLQESYMSGVNSYLLKPPEYDSYQESVRSLARYWLGLNLPSIEAATA